ncbi:MAG TPA: hypothetical protein HPP81_03250 [Deltaproteobacteria bacterium]|jgi:hypothetical protein|nr:hypothetical protein [Deltaproteobacteria bacterium]
MKWRAENLHAFLYLVSGIILLAGLGSSVLIYELSGDRSASVLGYEDAGGSVYPILPEDSKQYLRGLQLYGGTANVLADELRLWFAGLWHGKSLAFTVVCITILLSSGVFYTARRLPPRENANVNRRTRD